MSGSVSFSANLSCEDAWQAWMSDSLRKGKGLSEGLNGLEEKDNVLASVTRTLFQLLKEGVETRGTASLEAERVSLATESESVCCPGKSNTLLYGLVVSFSENRGRRSLVVVYPSRHNPQYSLQHGSCKSIVQGRAFQLLRRESGECFCVCEPAVIGKPFGKRGAPDFGQREAAMQQELLKWETCAGISGFVHPLFCGNVFSAKGKNKPRIVLPWFDGDLGRPDLCSRLMASEKESCVTQLLYALAQLHKTNRVHRDVKPENVLMKFGSRGEVTAALGDPGFLCKVGDPEGKNSGSPHYMAPEMAAMMLNNADLQRWYTQKDPGAKQAYLQCVATLTTPALDAWAVGLVAAHLLRPAVWNMLVGTIAEEVAACRQGQPPERVVNAVAREIIVRRAELFKNPSLWDRTLQQLLPSDSSPWNEVIRGLLKANPDQRSSCAACLECVRSDQEKKEEHHSPCLSNKQVQLGDGSYRIALNFLMGI